MPTDPRPSSVRQSLLRRWETTRGDLSRRRQERIARRLLVADLASYATNAEVDDLLATMRGRNEASDARIRAVVLGNLRDDTRLAGIAR